VLLHPPSLASLFIYSSRGKCSFPTFHGAFLTQPLFQAFPFQGCWAGAATPAFSGWLVYLQFREGLPLPRLHVLLRVFFLLLLLIIQFGFFSFFPGWGLVCPGGYADLAQGCLWEYCMLLSSPAGLCLLSQ
jgi:hypothetical protein